ncbi:MAG: hypothetical protein V4614_09935 [Pseudomonadota bacterium]
MRPEHTCKATLRHALALSALLLPLSVFAVQDCELNGESVNPNNGNTTAGKTGIMRCKDRDSGQMAREQELKAGKFTGLMRFYQNGKLQREYTENERGNRQGRYREFSADGKILRDENYDNGDSVGLSRSFYSDGQLRRASWLAQPGGEQASVDFTEKGQLNSLRCGDRPLLAPVIDDARLCGFSGSASSVEFFGSRGALNARSSYLAGKRIRHETFNDNGNPSSLDEITGNLRIQRRFSTSGMKLREMQYQVDGKTSTLLRDQEFAASGSLARDKRWVNGKLALEEAFYLNGQPRRKNEYGGEGTSAWMQSTDYYDSGKIAGTGRYANAMRGRQLPTGTHQRFNEAGKVIAESTYDERGRISREKAWSDAGELLRDDAVFEDGSRKAYSK